MKRIRYTNHHDDVIVSEPLLTNKGQVIEILINGTMYILRDYETKAQLHINSAKSLQLAKKYAKDYAKRCLGVKFDEEVRPRIK